MSTVQTISQVTGALSVAELETLIRRVVRKELAEYGVEEDAAL